jgi:hypothetical protein
MLFMRDRRTIMEQAESGLKIAGALVASFFALMLIAVAYAQIANGDGAHHVVTGWFLMVGMAIALAATVQFWSRWFYGLPAYFGVRLFGWFMLGWFSPSGLFSSAFPC